MKSFIAMLSLFTLITAQAYTVPTKFLVGMESRIENQKTELASKIASANTDDIVEGKIVASITYLVEQKLAKAAAMLDSLNESDLTTDKINEITEILDQADKLIEEI